MPAASKKQKRFLEMCIHNPSKAKKKCPSKSQAKKALGQHGTKKGKNK